jgi:hypothetical protein
MSLLDKLADEVVTDVSDTVAFLVLNNPLVALVEIVEVTKVSLAFRVVNKTVEEELLAIDVVENDVKPVLFVVVVELVVLLDVWEPVKEVDNVDDPVDDLVVDRVTKPTIIHDYFLFLISIFVLFR